MGWHLPTPMISSIRLFLAVVLLQTALSAPSSVPYQLQSNGVVCVESFGAVVPEDCRRAISELPLDDGFHWYKFLPEEEDTQSVPLPMVSSVGKPELDFSACPAVTGNPFPSDPRYCHRSSPVNPRHITSAQPVWIIDSAA